MIKAVGLLLDFVKNRSKFLPIFLIILFLFGCLAPRGVYHTVKKGETLYRICRTYRANVQEVAELNNIRDPAEIEAGRRIYIPRARRILRVVPYKQGGPEEKEPEEKIIVDKDRFIWPVNGRLLSNYGPRNGVRHDGIDIGAKEGTPIKAAESGEAVYVSSDMRGYGNIIIIKHKDDFYTVYAHNKDNLAKKGETVNKGDVIGSVGSTGNAESPHLHFEVRQGKTVRNPLFFLP